MNARNVLVLGHTGRPEVIDTAVGVLDLLTAAGFTPILLPAEAATIPHGSQVRVEPAVDAVMADAELVVVLGGDGTILRAAEMARGHAVPLLGVNLGHVGFLAEFEPEDLAEAVTRIARHEFRVEQRMTLDVVISLRGEVMHRTWALNEAAVEKGDRGRMIEVVTEVDGRPVASFGGDGVVLATPTGSTAYAFSSGGPVVWPQVEALLLTPISAHTLFTRPLVVAPTSVLAVEVLDRSSPAVVWCDGRRIFEVPPGGRVEVRRGSEPVRLARLVEGPFTDRLVAKFQLPVTGWRGPAAR
ncbi:MAG: NAD kinase [Actinomycetales bacterium]